jgi:hypothetical protein
MSQFECKWGHIMSSGDKECFQCAKAGYPGERIYYMDGLTSSQLRRQEEQENRRDYEETEDEYPE